MAAQLANADFLANALVSLDINAPPQFDADEFAAAFDNITIEEDDIDSNIKEAPGPTLPTRLIGPHGQYHELQLDFPALDLLNKGYEKFLIHEPKEIIFRDRPKLKNFHLRAENLTFSTRLDTPRSVGFSFLLPPELPAIEQHNTLVDLVQRLSCSPGISNLEVLQFKFYGHERIRFRLTTTFLLATGFSHREVMMYEYTAIEWQRYRAANRDLKWMKLLNNLVDRASDRAYLSAREKMKKADPKLVESDDSFIDKKWKMYNIGSANIVLFRRLDNFKKQVVEENGWQGTEQQYLIELECGHRMVLSLVYVLHRMPEEEVKSFCCSFCGERVLADRHLRRIELVHDHEKRALFLYKEPKWKLLRAQVMNDIFQIRVADLVAALMETLGSFDVPESVSPAELISVNSPETQIILQSFATLFGRSCVVMSAAFRFDRYDTRCLMMMNAIRVIRIHTGLAQSNVRMLKQTLPPLYFRFLGIWFTRAIVLCAAKVAEQKATAAKAAEEADRMKM
ncbi:hypothetical protein CLAFUR0_11396 [Fulvia fulva]|nr:hypothetical protein CLAFUR0_11396 [Fulvia fulva]